MSRPLGDGNTIRVQALVGAETGARLAEAARCTGTPVSQIVRELVEAGLDGWIADRAAALNALAGTGPSRRWLTAREDEE